MFIFLENNMSKISIESLFLKYPTLMIFDALDEIDINGATQECFLRGIIKVGFQEELFQ